MPANVYEGVRDKTGTRIFINGQTLDIRPSLALANHSPTGFEWGYSGSGPSQLALAILINEMPSDRALDIYQSFKEDMISRLGSPWRMTSAEIAEWLNRKKGSHDA
jgi:hypothetical protein